MSVDICDLFLVFNALNLTVIFLAASHFAIIQGLQVCTQKLKYQHVFLAMPWCRLAQVYVCSYILLISNRRLIKWIITANMMKRYLLCWISTVLSSHLTDYTTMVQKKRLWWDFFYYWIQQPNWPWKTPLKTE